MSLYKQRVYLSFLACISPKIRPRFSESCTSSSYQYIDSLHNVSIVVINEMVYNERVKMSKIVKHYPVMLANVINRIRSMEYQRAFTVTDCNFGFGGHSREILRHFPKAYIKGYDMDPKIIEYYRLHYDHLLSQEQRKRLILINDNFTSIGSSTEHFQQSDIFLADFGFNSMHIQTERGFSWLADEELDMRYSPKARKCSEIINQSSELEIISILERYGQLRESKHVAAAIVAKRPLKTTRELRQTVQGSFQEEKSRKIAQVFQAFRIACNDQLKNIQILCEKSLKYLKENGTFLAITFHSLQRDVTHNFVKNNKKNFSKIQTQLPSKSEIQENSRSKSAKMLVFKRTF